MRYSKLNKLANLAVITLAVFLSSNHLVYATTAADVTIYGSSISWENEASKTMLLERTPQWHEDVMKSLFNVYLHPHRYQLAAIQDTKQYNVQFLHAFWGPLTNPFNQYPRPAKAFVFLSNTNNSGPDQTYIAPVVKNDTDGNYYIFDKNQSQPILLNDWVTTIKTAHGAQTLRFNICNGYGNLPTETCDGKGYQDEVAYYQKAMFAALSPIPSAHRLFNEDWKMKVKMTNMRKATNGGLIYNESIAWDNVDKRKKLLDTVEIWPNYNVIKDNFEKIRDIRYFRDEAKPNFLRRISWLYPDDGCWTRAAAVIKDLFGPFKNIANSFSRPSKLFAFGNLCVNTPNSPNGRVTWWYHTAPIIRDAQTNQTYVLDPAVNPNQPLAVEKWMEEVSSQSKACAGSSAKVNLFNICNGYGVGPYDECQGASVNFNTETFAMLGQLTYRNYERRRQVELHRDADKVLGDLPPWSNPTS